ncbi:DUF1028 domain-containing protein [Halobacteriales archaeon QS_6_71_20]|nr:MAG: DUF1028 domain-containing protein [Halobacteriales archaeon QS_6_71_20]
MTFSICVREEYTDEDGDRRTRFGVAVTTRLPGVGTLCPFASEHGAVATQSLVNVELGRKGIEYLDDGLAVEDALQSLLNADEGAEQRQLHGVDADGTFAFSGGECNDWYGHTSGENYTVAGNLLTGEAVVEAVASTYESDAFGDAPLSERLVDALAAGHEAGGDKRDHLPVQSAALKVETTEEREVGTYYDDLRVDATETPIADLRETFEEARRGQEILMEEYADEPADDDLGGETDGEASDDGAEGTEDTGETGTLDTGADADTDADVGVDADADGDAADD